MAPELSVVIPTRDRPTLLPQAVASALDSLPPGGEVVVIDDAGTPPADGVLPAHPRLRLLRNDAALGPAAARNRGVAEAQGTVILFLDDDDVLLPGYAAAVQALAATDPQAGWGFSPTLAHGSDGPQPAPVIADLGAAPMPPPFGRRHLAGLGCGFWIRKALFVEAGGLDPSLRTNEDTEFCLRLLSSGALPWRAAVAGVSIRETPRRTRRAPGTSVTRGTGPLARAGYFAAILDRHGGFLATAPALARHLHRRRLKMLAKAGRGTDGIAAARAAGDAGALPYFLANWLVYRLVRG